MGQAAPLIIAAVGTAAQHYNTRRQQKKQDSILSAGVTRQKGRQREADAAVQGELARLEDTSGEEQRQSAERQFLQRLRETRGQGEEAIPGVANASDRYTQHATQEREGSRNQAERIAELMSRIDAPALQRQKEGDRRLGLGSELDTLGNFSRGDEFVTRARARSVRKNPWVDLAGKAMQMYGSWAAGGAGGGGYSSAAAEASNRGMQGYSLGGGL